VAVPPGLIEEEVMHTTRKLLLGFFALFGLLVTLSTDVLAVVGRPLTPVSYAGVARRTVRRSTY
jgi:hypothetical protein